MQTSLEGSILSSETSCRLDAKKWHFSLKQILRLTKDSLSNYHVKRTESCSELQGRNCRCSQKLYSPY